MANMNRRKLLLMAGATAALPVLPPAAAPVATGLIEFDWGHGALPLRFDIDMVFDEMWRLYRIHPTFLVASPEGEEKIPAAEIPTA